LKRIIAFGYLTLYFLETFVPKMDIARESLKNTDCPADVICPVWLDNVITSSVFLLAFLLFGHSSSVFILIL